MDITRVRSLDVSFAASGRAAVVWARAANGIDWR